jgi:hypothetical protein
MLNVCVENAHERALTFLCLICLLAQRASRSCWVPPHRRAHLPAPARSVPLTDMSVCLSACLPVCAHAPLARLLRRGIRLQSRMAPPPAAKRGGSAGAAPATSTGDRATDQESRRYASLCVCECVCAAPLALASAGLAAASEDLQLESPSSRRQRRVRRAEPCSATGSERGNGHQEDFGTK